MHNAFSKNKYICCRLLQKSSFTSEGKIWKRTYNENIQHQADVKGSEDVTNEKIDIKTSNYAEVRNSPAFIDKLLLIKAILNASSSMLITAPKKMGKSTYLN